jgi:hypothetical protein
MQQFCIKYLTPVIKKYVRKIFLGLVSIRAGIRTFYADPDPAQLDIGMFTIWQTIFSVSIFSGLMPVIFNLESKKLFGSYG